MSSNANSKLKISSQLKKGNANRGKIHKGAGTKNKKIVTLNIGHVMKRKEDGDSGFRLASKKSNNGQSNRKTHAEKGVIIKVAWTKLE